jgi:hypothetical protein
MCVVYFFLEEGLVCDSALPATDFVFTPVLPSLSKDEALLATDGEVCLLLLFTMQITSFHWHDSFLRAASSLIPHCKEPVRTSRTVDISV